MRTRAAGNVIYNGKVMNFTSPKDAMDHGFALITEERKANGLFLKADITFNTTIANMNHYKNGFALSNDDIMVEISVTLGTADLRVNQLLKLGRGAVVELDRDINDNVDIYANDVLIGHGEVVITENETIGISVTDTNSK